MDDLNIIEAIPKIIRENKIKAKGIIHSKNIDFNIEKVNHQYDDKSQNMLYKSDNLWAMKDLLDKGYESKVDLIYIDPPFFTMANYIHRIEILNDDKKQSIETFGYQDIWEDGVLEYLSMITLRMFLMKELLSDVGSIYVHLDYRMVHYIKIIMDCIFGRDNFLNEIIWSYKSGGTSNKYFSRKHDNILVYTKTKDYIFNPQKEKSYNRNFKPYRFKNVVEYEDEIGWYTLVNLKDVWQLNMVGRTSRERVGYRTQKPENLLERIILSSSKEDSIVADFFGGSGTTAIVAQKNGRRWISSDLGDISTVIMRSRLSKLDIKPYTILNSNAFVYNNRLEYNLEVFEYPKHLTYRFDFLNFEIDLGFLNTNKKNTLAIEKIKKTKSLGLIEYIGIGYKYDENKITILFEELRSDDKLIINNEIEVNIEKDKEVVLRVVDIFGQEYLQMV